MSSVDCDKDEDKSIDPDLASAYLREEFLKQFAEYEPAPERQDDEDDVEVMAGDKTSIRLTTMAFETGEKEGTEEDEEIVVAHKIGVRSSRLLQWTTVGGNQA